MPISMDKYFSRFLFDFRKAQHCLIALIEKWKSAEKKFGKTSGGLLTELSKAYHCLPQDTLLARLNAYGFSLFALRLICSYLFNRQQRRKINESSLEVLFVVSQVSISGPFFMCYLPKASEGST